MKKTLLLSCLLLAFAASSSFADALLFTVNATPYDRQMARIRPVLTAPSHALRDPSLGDHRQPVDGRPSLDPLRIYHFLENPRRSPIRRACGLQSQSGRSLRKMRENGATNVRLVIGKRTSTSRQTHAWLAWDTESGSYVLDPTFNWAACTPAQVGKRNYQPLYAYAGSKKFRAASTLVAQN